MMKKFSHYSESQIREWYLELKKMYREMMVLELPFDRNHILPEEFVAEVLGVSVRTMRNYRAQKHLLFLKLDGRIYYIKPLLYAELILLSFGSRLGDFDE